MVGDLELGGLPPRTRRVISQIAPWLLETLDMRNRSGITLIGPMMLPVIDILISGFSGWSVSITSSS